MGKQGVFIYTAREGGVRSFTPIKALSPEHHSPTCDETPQAQHRSLAEEKKPLGGPLPHCAWQQCPFTELIKGKVHRSIAISTASLSTMTNGFITLGTRHKRTLPNTGQWSKNAVKVTAFGFAGAQSALISTLFSIWVGVRNAQMWLIWFTVNLPCKVKKCILTVKGVSVFV